MSEFSDVGSWPSILYRISFEKVLFFLMKNQNFQNLKNFEKSIFPKSMLDIPATFHGFRVFKNAPPVHPLIFSAQPGAGNHAQGRDRHMYSDAREDVIPKSFQISRKSRAENWSFKISKIRFSQNETRTLPECFVRPPTSETCYKTILRSFSRDLKVKII